MDGPQGLASVANAPTGSSGGGGLAGNSESDDGQRRYWCYQCNKEVVAVREEGNLEERSSAVVCAECRNGFVELLTAEPNIPRGLRRRRRPRGAIEGQMVALIEALEHLYPHQLVQLMQVSSEATRSNNANHPHADENQDSNSSDLIRHGDATPNSWEDRADDSIPVFQSSSENGRPGIQIEESSTQASEADLNPPLLGHDFSDERRLRRVVLRQRSQRHSDDDGGNDEEYRDDNIDVENLQLELQYWSSGPEDEDDEPDEWEEVESEGNVHEPEGADDEFDSSQTQGDFDTQIHAGATVVTDSGSPVEGSASQIEGEPRRHRRHRHRGHERQILPARARNADQSVHQYLLELLQNMVHRNVGVRVEFPDSPMYVGNPGDYLDAREFEQLLHQLAENDSSQIGAPPAAKSAVDALPSVLIGRSHLVEGTSVCAICKETIAIDEYAKQLPCNHLYHHDCIFPWLNARNSCPVCRYELPTDDPDYEEQRRTRDRVCCPPVRNSDGSIEETSNSAESVQETSREGNEEVSEIILDRNGIDMELLNGSHAENLIIEDDPQIEQTNDDFDDRPGNRHSTLRGTRRGWLSLVAGPVLSMVGLAFMICLGGHVMGGGFQPNGRAARLQQSNFLQEIQMEQRGPSIQVQNRRPWWMPFQR